MDFPVDKEVFNFAVEEIQKIKQLRYQEVIENNPNDTTTDRSGDVCLKHVAIKEDSR